MLPRQNLIMVDYFIESSQDNFDNKLTTQVQLFQYENVKVIERLTIYQDYCIGGRGKKLNF